MKNISILILIILFSTSCNLGLKWNYEFVERVIQNPDSLNILLNDTNNTSYIFRTENKHTETDNDRIIKKIKDNDFKSGYSIYNDHISGVYGFKYKEHVLYVKSDKTGKKIFFVFDNNDNGKWKIEELFIHLMGVNYNEAE